MTAEQQPPPNPTPPSSAAATAVAPRPAPPRVDQLPPFRVLLHNDDVNDADYVVETLVMVTTLREPEAIRATVEAHNTGVALILVTHRERAELYAERLTSKGLTATIEAAS